MNGATSVVESEPISLRRIERKTVEIDIIGTQPLIVHNWSQKAKMEMADKQSGSKIKKSREARDPLAEFESSRYRLDDGRDGMPATAFKSAIVGAARLFEGVTLVQLKQALYIHGEVTADGSSLVPIVSDGPSMRTDMVRVGMGTADLRYRAQYWPWSAILTVTFQTDVVDLDSVVALVEAGGFGGVGEWRPSTPKGLTGMYGTWEVMS